MSSANPKAEKIRKAFKERFFFKNTGRKTTTGRLPWKAFCPPSGHSVIATSF